LVGAFFNKYKMKLQVIHDSKGQSTGVFIPIEDWTMIKNQYPDIEITVEDLPQWEKDLIDSRLEAIAENPNRLKPGTELFKELRRNI
jgi:hypothetical protein